MAELKDIITQIELHSVEGIKRCFNEGVSANSTYKGRPLIFELTSEYTRSPRFKECVKAFVEYGLEFEDNALLAVLLDDDGTLEQLITADKDLVHSRFSLDCAYTPLSEATLLHICAEFNHSSCAEVLLAHGADVDARAGTDSHGFGRQTAVFHTVNQNSNQSAEMLDLLLVHGTDLSYTVKGLIWGKGYEWETFIPSVNPISYAMMGMLPQMHRDEHTIAAVVSKLMKHAYGVEYESANVPNKYLS